MNITYQMSKVCVERLNVEKRMLRMAKNIDRNYNYMDERREHGKVYRF